MLGNRKRETTADRATFIPLLRKHDGLRRDLRIEGRPQSHPNQTSTSTVLVSHSRDNERYAPIVRQPFICATKFSLISTSERPARKMACRLCHAIPSCSRARRFCDGNEARCQISANTSMRLLPSSLTIVCRIAPRYSQVVAVT